MPTSAHAAATILSPRFVALAAALLIPFVATATPTIALHGTEIVGDQSGEADALHALVTAEFSRRGVPLVSAGAVQSFLDKRSDKGCMALSEADRTACMAELARAVGADRAVVVTIAPFVPRKLLLSGVVVSREGELIQTLSTIEYTRAPGSRLEPTLQAALADFVSRFDLSEHPSKVKIEPVIATTQAPSAPEAPVLTPPSSSGRQNLTIAGLIAGTVFAGLGTWGMLDSSSRYNAIDDAYARGALPPQADKERITRLRNEAQRSRAVGLVGLGLGAAAIGTSVLLLMTAPASAPATSAEGHASLLVGPMAVGVSIPLR